MAKVLDGSLEVSVFGLQSYYYALFQTNTLGRISIPLVYRVSQLFLYTDGFGIKQPIKVDMSLKTKNSSSTSLTRYISLLIPIHKVMLTWKINL